MHSAADDVERVTLLLDVHKVGDLAGILQVKRESLDAFYQKVNIAESECRARLERAAATGDFHYFKRKKIPTLKVKTVYVFPDGNFDQLRECLPKLADCIKGICEPLYLIDSGE